MGGGCFNIHDYNINFNGIPCYTVGSYNYKYVWLAIICTFYDKANVCDRNIDYTWGQGNEAQRNTNSFV